jgi:hypothetical protein
MAERLRRLPRKQIPSGALVQIQLTAQKVFFAANHIAIWLNSGNLQRGRIYRCRRLAEAGERPNEPRQPISRLFRAAGPLAPPRPITAGDSLLPDAKLFPSFCRRRDLSGVFRAAAEFSAVGTALVPTGHPNAATRIAAYDSCLASAIIHSLPLRLSPLQNYSSSPQLTALWLVYRVFALFF